MYIGYLSKAVENSIPHIGPRQLETQTHTRWVLEGLGEPWAIGTKLETPRKQMKKTSFLSPY